MKMFFTIDKFNNITWYNIDWALLIIIFCIGLMLTLSLLIINHFFAPLTFFRVIRETNELKELDIRTTRQLKESGFITKLIFRIFSKGAERYFP